MRSLNNPISLKPRTFRFGTSPRPRYLIGLVGTEEEKQALQKEKLAKFMVQQAMGAVALQIRFVSESLKADSVRQQLRKFGCSESTFSHVIAALRCETLQQLFCEQMC